MRSVIYKFLFDIHRFYFYFYFYFIFIFIFVIIKLNNIYNCEVGGKCLKDNRLILYYYKSAPLYGTTSQVYNICKIKNL